MIAGDIGSNGQVAFHGGGGPIPTPKVAPSAKTTPEGCIPRGLNTAEKFAARIALMLERDHVVFEAATIGSSGIEKDHIAKIVASAPHTLFTISGRMVKNYAKDNGLNMSDLSDADAARIIHWKAVTSPDSLQVWRMRENTPERKKTSVRPYDKRDYKDPEVTRVLALLPEFPTLPEYMQKYLGNGKGSYAPTVVMPLAMALEEPEAINRNGYEWVIGLYGDGYPSFYRRAVEHLRQIVAKDLAGVDKKEEVTPLMRKKSWKLTRRLIRHMYHLSVN